MRFKDPAFYDKLGIELEGLGFRLFTSSMDLFPIWFNSEKQIYIQAVSLLHFELIKKQISPQIWQESIVKNRNQFNQFLCIWEDNWYHRRDFIKAYIVQLLHGNKSIFARDLKVDCIPESLSSAFLERTHILGASKGKTYLGIFVPPHRHFRGIESTFDWEGNPLVAVAVFGKTLVMKNQQYIGQHSTELIRFASLPETRVVGGITKAISFYKKTFLVDNVMTYVDLEWNKGRGFLGIGFKLESLTNPLLFKIDSSLNRVLVQNWADADVCNAGNSKLRYELK